MARPKKFIKEGQYKLITEMAARGLREVDIARGLGMAFTTWARIKDEDPKALDALEEGRGIEHEALVGKLFDMAMKGNVVALLFALKSRHGYREGIAIEHNSNVRVTFDLPGALSTDQYAKVIEQEIPALPGGKDER
ncbi:MAG: hypothetical protein ABW140_10730 [Candidatus Sedimenticola sp. 6PFRAG1]